MKVEVLKSDLLNENCYLITNNYQETIIIDPGISFEIINEYINNKNYRIIAVLLTHGHFDHIRSCKQLQDLNIPIFIHKLDKDKCLNNSLNLSSQFDIFIENFIPNCIFDSKIAEVKIGNFIVTVLHTPGHSKGSVCYLIDNYIFTGDTCFKNGYGRTDFYDGNESDMYNSLKIIKEYLNQGYILCDGHS